MITLYISIGEIYINMYSDHVSRSDCETRRVEFYAASIGVYFDVNWSDEQRDTVSERTGLLGVRGKENGRSSESRESREETTIRRIFDECPPINTVCSDRSSGLYFSLCAEESKNNLRNFFDSLRHS